MLPKTPSWGGSARKVLREARVRDRFQRLTTRVRTGPEYAERREIQRRRDERQDVIDRGYRQFREWVTVETLPQKRLWRLGKLFAKYIRKRLIKVDVMMWYMSKAPRTALGLPPKCPMDRHTFRILADRLGFPNSPRLKLRRDHTNWSREIRLRLWLSWRQFLDALVRITGFEV